MDHDDDVERLFSWIKTPDLRYREFAGEREVADAVATWPALRKTADETGRADDASAEPAPTAEPEPPPPAASGRSPLGERLASIFGQQRDPAVPQAEPVFRRIETPEPPAPAGEVPWEPEAPPPSSPPAAAPQERRENPFGGTYRGFENEEEVEPPPVPSPPQASPPEAPPADPNARSLDAVFSRLARPAQRYRDERQRAAGGSGLGPVFRRLR